MSLRRFLTGNPGNITEFVQMVKERGLPVTVLFNLKRERNLASSVPIIMGKIVYFGGNFEYAIVNEG